MKQAWVDERLERQLNGWSPMEAFKMDMLNKWSMSIVHSRGFRSSTFESVYLKATQDDVAPKKVIDMYDPETLLFPMLDMMNHSPTTRNVHVREEKKYSLVCNDSPGPGDEIFNTYGFKSKRPVVAILWICFTR